MDDLIEHWQNFLDALDDGCVEFNDSGMRSMAKRTIEALKPVEKLKGTCEKHPHLAVPVGCICHYCLDEERRICIQMLQAVVNKLQARIEELEAAWKDSIDGVERIAFNIEPPNEHTPRLIMWVNQMRNEMTRITTGG